MKEMLEKWCNILTIVSGKNQETVVSTDGRFPIYGSGGIIGYASSYLCEAGTTIIGRKGTINKPIYVNQKFWNIDTAFGISPGKRLDSKYLYFFCCSFNFQALDKSTTIPSLSKKDLLQIQMTVPSLEEQKRIVAKIEELFSLIALGVSLVGLLIALAAWLHKKKELDCDDFDDDLLMDDDDSEYIAAQYIEHANSSPSAQEDGVSDCEQE